jgi:N6-L-threonylcarbamoyladenine synthase
MIKKIICLGIESTAHTFGVAIVDDKCNVLANVADTFTTEKGGIVPLEAAKHHEQIKGKLVDEALKKANFTLKDINIIAFSQGPGLSPCLLQGMHKAAELAKIINVPLVPVNHCIAHLEIGRKVCKAKDPVLLYASGANTQIIAYASGKYRIFGETLDQGIGNFIDSFGRHMGMGFPGGPKIAALAERADKSKLIELPYSIKGMDVSFTGILTNLKQKYDSKKFKTEDLAFALQEHAFAMLIEAAERAMAHLGKKELLLGGGVACNKRLQEMASIMAKERSAKSFVPPNFMLVDNATMIAWTGILEYKAGIKIKPEQATIMPYERTDQVDVKWRND